MVAWKVGVKPADAACLDPLQLRFGGLDQRQHLFGQPQQPHSRRREPHRARAADEKLDPDLVFQRLDLMGQRRLGDVEHLGGAGQPALLVNRPYGAKMAQF